MKFYFAPMEGITGRIYRNAFHDFFQGVDRFYSPFISSNQEGVVKGRSRKDVLPENNQGIHLIPQILSNNPEQCLQTIKELQNLGYDEVNLNFGCPSRTVVSKGKGSGFLAKPDELDRFLYELFEKSELPISVKTRVGKDSPDEFAHLLEIYNQYPLAELIVHPRIQQDFYKNTPKWDVFALAYENCKSPLCYNGDLFTKEDYEHCIQTFPKLESVMLGRGLLCNPGLVTWITEGKVIDKNHLRKFHDRLYADYMEEMSGDRPLLFKMKELWLYMIHLFSDSEKYGKKIKKANHLGEYEAIVNKLFAEQEIVMSQGYEP